jgi:hypothetical protein
MLSVVLLNDLMLSVIMLSVVAPTKGCLNSTRRSQRPYSQHFIFSTAYEWAQ